MTEVKSGTYESSRLLKILGLYFLISFLLGAFSLIDENSPSLSFLLGFFFYCFFLYYMISAMGFEAFCHNPALSIKKQDIPRSALFVLLNILFAVVYVSVISVPPSDMWDVLPEYFHISHLIAFLSLCLAAPLVEELLFRDFIWKIFERKNYSKRKILILTSIIFALAHLELVRLPILLVTGLLLGVLRQRTGRLGASILAHFLINLIAFCANIKG